MKKDVFSSKLGVIAAAAGSAVGLGNIWKFPYIAGVYGGAAFLFVYLGFILAIGLPIMLAEFLIGRKSGSNVFGAFKVLAPNTKWKFVGLLGVAAAFMILAFYGVVAGWSINYVVKSLSNSFASKNAQELSTIFHDFTNSTFEPILYQLVFMIITAAIVIIGVRNGIERFSKFLMPILVIIIVILCIRSVTLDGAYEGLMFLFKPDFSKLNSEAILSALGHAFFSLSLGMGTLVTYGAYIDKKTNLLKTAVFVTLADTIIAILAGVAIFPAVFAFGIEPSSGPSLVFITLPNVFQQMTGGYIFSILFFLLLSLAALTSSVSILEVVVAYFKEEFKMKRRTATIIATLIICVFGVLCSLSMGMYGDIKLYDLNFFDLLDWIAANLLLPLGGLFISLFVGWKLGFSVVKAELAHGSSIPDIYIKIFIFLLRYIAPVFVAIVFLHGLGVFDVLD